jgi:hypothetical protein
MYITVMNVKHGLSDYSGPFSHHFSDCFYPELNICSLRHANNGYVARIKMMIIHEILEEKPEENYHLNDEGDGRIMFKYI